jgi:hypothetical protein
MKLQHVASTAIDELAARLDESGVRAHVISRGDRDPRGPVATLDVGIDDISHRIHVDLKSRWTSGLDTQLERMVDDGIAASSILVLPRLDKTRRAWLRARGINHADMTGAVYLRLPGMLIHVDGGAKGRWERVASPERTVNPFSKKASLVLRQFFESPATGTSVSAIARATGIAIGWAWDVAEELSERGYIAGEGDQLRLADAASVLAHWCNTYSWKKSVRRNFVVPYTKPELEQSLVEAWTPSSLPWALTLLSGADRRIGHVLHDNSTVLYALPGRPAELDALLATVHAREVAAPVPGTHTLCVLEPYYGPSALFGMAIRDGLPVVSDLQLFLDLAHYPVRGVEAAVHLLRTRLGPAVAMTPADIARVERSLS